MANSNDYFNTDTNTGYTEEYEDEFSHDYEEEEYKSKRSFKLPKLPKGGSAAGLSGLVVPVAVVLCLIFSILCLTGINSVKENLSYNTNVLNAELQAVKQANSEILAHLAAVEAGLDTAQSAIAGSTSSKYIQITKQPSSTPTTVGRENALIFQVDANGNHLKMTWQKYDQVSGEWINVPFDIDGYEAEMGLRLYDNSVNGISQLYTNVLTAKAFGTYRCVITDNMGSQVISDVVELSEKTAE